LIHRNFNGSMGNKNALSQSLRDPLPMAAGR